MIELRPYQVEAVAALRRAYAEGAKAPILQLATGGGKTVIFGDITRRVAAKGSRVLVLVHRRELVRQASAKLTEAGVPHGIVAAGFPPSSNEPVQVASVQTLARREIGRFDLAIIDECHHARATIWRRLLDALAGARLLGCTATPARLDGKGLGTVFDRIVSGPPVGKLIAAGYLAPVRCFAPERQIQTRGLHTRLGDFDVGELAAAASGLTGDAVEHYHRRADHLPAIAFCATVAHAEQAAEAFRGAGYRSACVHGKLDPRERDRVISGLGTGEVEVLTSCDLISEGLDVPSVGAVVLLRPTQSLVLHLQQIGRGMRPAPGKTLVVNDHAGNVLRHGLPEIERRWSLDGAERQPGRAPEKVCPSCGAIIPAGAAECECCGHSFAGPRRRAPEQAPGRLVEVRSDADLLQLPYQQIVQLRLTEAQLRAYAAAHGYKPGWVWHRLRDQRRSA